MALELIGVGFGRTGTASLQLALNRLGLPCYHMKEVLAVAANRPQHLDFWLEVARSEPGVQHDWERVFDGYRATVDNPGACVWRELLEAYPDAKVLLSLHPKGPDAWHQSTYETIYAFERLWQGRVLARWIPFARKMNEMASKLIWQRFHEGTMRSPEQSIERYQRHVEEVTAEVPADRLLVFRATDGWQPLCDFLGVPVPDEPFPRVNERAEFKQRIAVGRMVGNVLRLAEIGVPLLVAGALAWQILR